MGILFQLCLCVCVKGLGLSDRGACRILSDHRRMRGNIIIRRGAEHVRPRISAFVSFGLALAASDTDTRFREGSVFGFLFDMCLSLLSISATIIT